MDQRELVERARRGDHDAFGLLVTGSVAQLEAVARLILRDPELARDAVQEAFIRAWRDLPGLRDPGRFDAWLHRLIVNASLDAARRRRRRPIEVQLTPIDPSSVAAWDGSVADSAGQVADRDALERAFAYLTPDQRAAVVLRHYVGMRVPEVADVLGIPLGTAQSRLHRALETMRAAIAADDRVELATERESYA